MGSIAAARRTQSSYPIFLAGTNPSDLSVSVYEPNGGSVAPITAALSRAPGVKAVRTVELVPIAPLGKNGQPIPTLTQAVLFIGSVDGETTFQDRLTAVQGKLADPGRPDEVTMTATAAQLYGLHVGQRFEMGLYRPSQTSGNGSPGRPALLVHATLVGIVVQDNEVVQDDIDRAYGFGFVTPALMHQAIARVPSIASPITYGVQLRDGASGVPQLEREIVGLVPPRATYSFHVTEPVITQAELAIKPESVALGGFGAIAALVCLVLGIQAISRQLRLDDEDRQVLRGLGAGPGAAGGDGLLGVGMSVVAGALLAFVLAVALSPLAPLGPVRPIYPGKGISFDWTVLAGGFALLVVVLSVAALALGWRGAPHRLRRLAQQPVRASRLVARAETAGLPVAGAIGARFALDPGKGRRSVPVRSAMLGAVVAIVTVVATLTFASSLHTLVSDPPLYGWNWSYALNPTNDVPPAALTLLAHDRDVAAFTGVQYLNFALDGQTIPVLISAIHPAVSPPVLTGHGLDARNQIVIGAATLAALHKQVGDTVYLTYGNRSDAPLYVPRTKLMIVGTATFPAVGYASFVEDHTSMGTGALFAFGALPAAMQRAIQSGPDPNFDGPGLVFVRLAPGVSAAAGRANLQQVADAANRMFAADPNPQAQGNTVGVLGVQRPAQIVNYKTIGDTPVVLAIGLAAGAVVALGLALLASVRRRRFDLALLKALGCSPGQLRAAVAWQATIAALVGVVVGLPLGIVTGRLLWDAFARNLNAVPDPVVPALSVVFVALGAVAFANLVAALPGSVAARTSTAVLLRAE